MPATRRSRATKLTVPAIDTSLAPFHLSASRCEACSSDRVTRLSMTLTDGSPVDFTSCHRCEHKTWRASGAAVELTSVLTKATKPRALAA